MWSHLNQYDLPEADPAYSDARRRLLGRLGEYAAAVVAPLNLRPTAAALLFDAPERVEVRISTPGRHTVLVLSPEGDLSGEVFFLRAVAAKSLPMPQVITYDLSRTAMPFAYALEGYISGNPATTLPDGPLLRAVARQLGRTLRRTHMIAAPGCGRPLPTGRWPNKTWHAALLGWLEQQGYGPRAQEVLGVSLLERLHAATLDHPSLERVEPRVIHGAVEPERVIASVGDHVQLEALQRPGMLVGGDPMFDLAHALQPHHPESFRQGVWEAYGAAGVLDAARSERLARMRLLLQVAATLARADAEACDRLPEQVAAALRELA